MHVIPFEVAVLVALLIWAGAIVTWRIVRWGMDRMLQ